MGQDRFTCVTDQQSLDLAANKLADSHPHLSARGGLTPQQISACLFAVAGLIALALVSPSTIYWAGFCVFAVLIAWRGYLVLSARSANGNKSAENNSATDLPNYSVLVALYDEASSVSGLIHSLSQLDYPPHRLDIHLLLEANDGATISALRQCPLPSHFHVHILGSGIPQTKPRALNYGLECAKGDFVTIFDAEDRPHPAQLRRAAETFLASSSHIACLQAPLMAHNHEESWIAAQWALEYDIQFGLLVPALSRGGFPIPLGGTSNHFRYQALADSGGWDAWNVTEDADLGLRLARQGYGIGTIAPPTLEEAPESLSVWVNQRSRWIKGFLQSWFVIMRTPMQSLRDMGLGNWLAMQLTLGGAIISATLAGPMSLWLFICFISPSLDFGTAGLFLLASGYGVNIFAALAAPGKWSARRVATVASLPLYWPLLSLGAARALYGLVVTPHFWAKTPHGLTAAALDEGLTHCPPSTGLSPFAR